MGRDHLDIGAFDVGLAANERSARATCETRCARCGAPDVTVCIPVHNGADHIVRCLERVSQFDFAGKVHVVCVANGCTDDSADRARRMASLFLDNGWELSVIELDEVGKSAAIRCGEERSPEGLFVALDVNVLPAVDSLHHLIAAANTDGLRVASAQLRYVETGSSMVRHFARAYGCSPFARSNDIKGTFTLFSHGHREVVKTLPDVGADDRYFLRTAARSERGSVEAAAVDYYFPSTFAALVRQQIRWKRGNRHVDATIETIDAPSHENSRWPYFRPRPPAISVAVYVAVTLVATLVARLRPHDKPAWRR